jgi:hypothetical protein
MYPHDHLVKARRDDLMRSAAQCRLAAQARPPRAPRRQRMRTAPVVRLLAGIRALRIRPISP